MLMTRVDAWSYVIWSPMAIERTGLQSAVSRRVYFSETPAASPHESVGR